MQNQNDLEKKNFIDEKGVAFVFYKNTGDLWIGGPQKENKTRPHKESKTAKIIEMLQHGTTRKEVLKATGWKAVSMQQVAKNAGVKLRPEKLKKKPTFYKILTRSS